MLALSLVSLSADRSENDPDRIRFPSAHRRSLFHELRLIFLIGQIGGMGRMGPIIVFDGIDGLNGIDG